MKIYMCFEMVPDSWLGPRTAEHAPGHRYAWVCVVAKTKAEIPAMLTGRHHCTPAHARSLTREMRQVTLPVVPDHNSIRSPHRSGIADLLDSGIITTDRPGVYVWEDREDGTPLTEIKPERVTLAVFQNGQAVPARKANTR